MSRFPSAPNPDVVHFKVPLLPPSVNHMRVGGRYVKTKEAQAFIDAVCLLSRREVCEGPFYGVTILYIIPEKEFLRWDVDNFLKISCDALATAGVIKNDRYVLRLTAEKLKSLDGEARTLFHVFSMKAAGTAE